MPAAGNDLDALMYHVSTSYAGFADKTKARADELEELTQVAKTKFARATDDAQRTAALREWMSFFRDRHMILVARNEADGQAELSPKDGVENLRLSQLDPEAWLLRIPTFAPTLAQPINDLLVTHEEDLKACRILIIDLQGNGGGADYVFYGLIPLIYSGPIDLVGDDYWASRENTTHMRKMLDSGMLPAQYHDGMLALIKRMDENPNTFVCGAEDQTIVLSEVLPRPERIGMIIDERCASTTEEFLLLSRQSRKVAIFGRNTKGCLDYSNLRDIELPSGAYVLRLPMSRSRRLPAHPVDETGIPPDVRMPESEADPIGYAHRYLRAHVGGEAELGGGL